mmetsp:Transcript_60407/g.174941  ORF Transcript_60407/g.174941 Transcript_60407/m.174941 type:complete len:243 (+) Transcript_60407:778-1506(+)
MCENAEAPHVAGRSVRPFLRQDLGRSVGDGANVAPHSLDAAPAEAKTDAPIDDLHMVVRRVLGAKAHVLRLQIPVRDTSAMRVLQRAGDLPDDADAHLLGQAPLLAYAVEKLAPGAILHDEVHSATMIIAFEDLADARVVQVLHDEHLSLEVPAHVAIHNDDLLDCHTTLFRGFVRGHEYPAISTRTELPRVDVVSLRDRDLEVFRDQLARIQAAVAPGGCGAGRRIGGAESRLGATAEQGQ